ncbi:MAG: spore germination protein [Defluviitaleaceae bacterium]|nr:spore germination protein [Defluviitaleaceae bacterium]
MFALNNKISLRQVQALLFLEIFGFGVTALPRRTAEHAAQDGWLGVVLAVFGALLITWLITSVVKLNIGQTFYDYTKKLFGGFIASVFCLLLSIRFILLAAFYLRIFAEITQVVMLPTTPFFVIFIAVLSLAAYGASKGIEARGRLAEMLILIVLLPLIFVFGISSKEIDFTNLLPLFAANSTEIGKAGYQAFFAFGGIEFLLLISPFLSRPKGFRKSAMGTIATMGGFMVIITAVTIARFGPLNVVAHNWPVLKMMDTVSLPGSIIDRQGALIMTFWIISAYAIINAALFFSSLLLKDVAKRGKHIHYILLCLPIIALAANIPSDLDQVYEWFNLYNNTFGVATMVGLPLIIFVASMIRKGRDKIAQQKANI